MVNMIRHTRSRIIFALVVTACTASLLALGAPCVPPPGIQNWIDADTPASACSRKVCIDDYETCTGPIPTRESLSLVFSDEFNKDNRGFDVKDNDPAWVARDVYYGATNDDEVYLPEQATTANGSCVLRMEFLGTANATSSVQDAFQPWSNYVSKHYKSAMLQTWNKFCFTGGYIEASVKLPGDRKAAGLWPALWFMGNIARPGNIRQAAGLWPYSYHKCKGSGAQNWDVLPGMKLPACPDLPVDAPDRTEWGMYAEQGRGAPEIDLFEMFVYGYTDNATNTTVKSAGMSQTLQMAPISPIGTHWLDKFTYFDPFLNKTFTWENPFFKGKKPGLFFPGAKSKFLTGPNAVWCGDLSVLIPKWSLNDSRLSKRSKFYKRGRAEQQNCTAFMNNPGQKDQIVLGRAAYLNPGEVGNLSMVPRDQPPAMPPKPGSVIQDSLSAISWLMNDTFFTDFHTYGLLWEPGEYIRWYIDGEFLYEVNKNALQQMENYTHHMVGERLIPLEPMSIIFNLGMSPNFVAPDYANIKFPAEMHMDWIRLWQKPGSINVDCSPLDYPTAQYIATHAEDYVNLTTEGSLVDLTAKTTDKYPNFDKFRFSQFSQYIGTAKPTLKDPSLRRPLILLSALVGLLIVILVVVMVFNFCGACDRMRGFSSQNQPPALHRRWFDSSYRQSQRLRTSDVDVSA